MHSTFCQNDSIISIRTNITYLAEMLDYYNSLAT